MAIGNVRVFVGVIFFAEGTISFFDISFRSGSVNIEELVIVLRAVN
jgi:hypothetical protein